MDGYGAISFPPSPADVAAGKVHGSPNPPQEEFLSLPNKIVVLIGGFGVGKSEGGMFADARTMLRNPGSNGMVIAPTYRQADIVRNKMEDLFERVRMESGIQLIQKVTRSSGKSTIELTNGSKADLFTAGNRTAWYGPDMAWIHIEEWEWMDRPESVLDSCIHRLRQQTVPGLRTINERRVFITSTAQTVSGPLVGMINRAQEEKRKAEKDEDYVPEVGVVVAPSDCAIGYGLTEDMIRTWHASMDERTFARAVACDLSPPPEVVYADYVNDDNIVDWTFQPTCKTFFLVDWGIHHSHWLAAQWSPQHDALVVFREWGPGPEEPAGVGECIYTMRLAAREWGLVDERGLPKTRGLVEVIGDPTPNPKQQRIPDEEEILAAEGDRMLRGLRWLYRFPANPRYRRKHNQVTLNRMLLRPKNGKPRVLFAKQITTQPDRMTKASHTRLGIWPSLKTGLRYKRDATMGVLEKIDKKTGYDHAHDCLCYGNVMIFNREFDRLLHEHYGALVGASNM